MLLPPCTGLETILSDHNAGQNGKLKVICFILNKIEVSGEEEFLQ